MLGQKALQGPTSHWSEASVHGSAAVHSLLLGQKALQDPISHWSEASVHETAAVIV